MLGRGGGGEEKWLLLQCIHNWAIIWYVLKYVAAENTEEHKQAASKKMDLVKNNSPSPRSDLFFPFLWNPSILLELYC